MLQVDDAACDDGSENGLINYQQVMMPSIWIVLFVPQNLHQI